MPDESASTAVVSLRLADGKTEDGQDWAYVSAELLAAAVPWRLFRWYKGQKHYSGSYWAATEHQHVVYESRLELARLLFADFDVAVTRIIAQPFLVKADVGGALRGHVPDYLLCTAAGLVIVDVKPRSRLDKPNVVFTLAWTRQLVESRGWRYEVWSEPPSAELENVRFLAGYRRHWLFAEGLLNALQSTDLDGATLGDAFRSQPRWPRHLVRSAVLHLLWRHHFVVDLARPLSSGHVVRMPT